MIILTSCYKEEVVFNSSANAKLDLPLLLRLNDKECFQDYTSQSLRYALSQEDLNDFSALVEFQDYSEITFEDEMLLNNSVTHFGDIELNRAYELTIKTRNQTKFFTLTFTNLPTVRIVTPNKIVDEPKTLAKISVNYPEASETSEEYYIGIEYRGGYSQSFDKKSYGIELKGSLNLGDDISGSFFDKKKNNDWILDAMWIDRSRLRNKTSFEIWNSMNSDNDYGIESEFVELYLNNEFQGIYCLNEQMNAELLNITSSEGVLYKAVSWENGATEFNRYSNSSPPLSNYWDGWEHKYPDPDIKLNWSPLRQLRNLAVNGSDEEFLDQITNHIDIDQFMDYYIFLNLTSALDNTGKNTFLVKESGSEKLKIIPWDLDGSFGLYWDGSSINHISILTNNIYTRLFELNPNDIIANLKLRWNSLRTSELSVSALNNAYSANFETLKISGTTAEENRIWGSTLNLVEEEAYTLNWIGDRLSFLDLHFDGL
ncbi:MAG: CotH kinase family protein [Flavobacteriales bacterium]